MLNDFRLSSIAALYIDSTKQADARSIFADLLKHTSITNTVFQFSDAYDHGKLAAYLYMAVTQKPLKEGHDPLSTLYCIIKETITKRSTLQLPGLHILEIAVKHVHETASVSPDWLRKLSSRLLICAPGKTIDLPLETIDDWVLLHLDTLLAPKPCLCPEVKMV